MDALGAPREVSEGVVEQRRRRRRFWLVVTILLAAVIASAVAAFFLLRTPIHNFNCKWIYARERQEGAGTFGACDWTKKDGY